MCPSLRKLPELIDLIDQLKFRTLNFTSNEVLCKPKRLHHVKLYLF